MPRTRQNVHRPATERLRRIIEKALEDQGLTGEAAARHARLPANAFRSFLRRGHQPTLQRAHELLVALGVSMVIGVENPRNHVQPDEPGNDD